MWKRAPGPCCYTPVFLHSGGPLPRNTSVSRATSTLRWESPHATAVTDPAPSKGYCTCSAPWWTSSHRSPHWRGHPNLAPGESQDSSSDITSTRAATSGESTSASPWRTLQSPLMPPKGQLFALGRTGSRRSTWEKETQPSPRARLSSGRLGSLDPRRTHWRFLHL
jgi:hypothetical protein